MKLIILLILLISKVGFASEAFFAQVVEKEVSEFIQANCSENVIYKLNNYKVINDTIKSGENFSEILDRHHIEYPKVLEIVNTIIN